MSISLLFVCLCKQSVSQSQQQLSGNNVVITSSVGFTEGQDSLNVECHPSLSSSVSEDPVFLF